MVENRPRRRGDARIQIAKYWSYRSPGRLGLKPQISPDRDGRILILSLLIPDKLVCTGYKVVPLFCRCPSRTHVYLSLCSRIKDWRSTASNTYHAQYYTCECCIRTQLHSSSPLSPVRVGPGKDMQLSLANLTVDSPYLPPCDLPTTHLRVTQTKFANFMVWIAPRCPDRPSGLLATVGTRTQALTCSRHRKSWALLAPPLSDFVTCLVQKEHPQCSPICVQCLPLHGWRIGYSTPFHSFQRHPFSLQLPQRSLTPETL